MLQPVCFAYLFPKTLFSVQLLNIFSNITHISTVMNVEAITFMLVVYFLVFELTVYTHLYCPAKPEWITRPQDTTAGSNTTVVLPCDAFAIPSVQYTWFFNGKPMIWTERHNFTGGNLTIKRLKPADNGMYQCFVSNKHGQLHADIELTVSGKIILSKLVPNKMSAVLKLM